MKNEELLELITELKVDDAFVEEALAEPDSGEPVKAYAGKAKLSPMRIAAPVAACLAVAAAAGIVLTNINRSGRSAVGSTNEESISESDETSGSESGETSEENSETGDTQIIGTGIDDTNLYDTVIFDKAFIEKCKDLVRSENELVAQSDAIFEVEWQIKMGDVDLEDLNHDGVDEEILICPRINGESVMGVRVFKRDANGNPFDLGSFGTEFSNMSIEVLNCIENYDPNVLNCFYNLDFLNYSTIYYYNNTELNEKCIESIQEIYFDNDTKKLQERTYLRYVKTYPADASSSTPLTETAYRYGSEISVKELLDEWSRVSSIPFHFFPKPKSASIAHLEAAECVQLLVDKYNVPLNGGSPASLHHMIRTFDINMDGKDETVLEFKDCEQLPGIYVFSFENDKPRLIGELDLVNERGIYQEALNNSTVVERTEDEIRKFDDGNESFYFYCSNRVVKIKGKEGYRAEAGRGDVNKIVVKEDGTLGIEMILSNGAEVINGAIPGIKDIHRINGENVTEKQCWEEKQNLMYKSVAVPYK